MSFTMASLLAHSEVVPAAAREALLEALSEDDQGTSTRRTERLESAARILLAETGLGCSDARELVDLRPGDCGCA